MDQLFVDACAAGDMAGAELRPAPNRETLRRALCGACEHGRLEVVKWLHSTFELNVEDVRSFNDHALSMACHKGHLEIAKWLHTTFGTAVRSSEAIRSAYLSWRVDVLEWMIGAFAITVADLRYHGIDGDWNEALCWASEYRRIDFIKWLHATFTLTGADARSLENTPLHWACESGSLELAQWLHATFALTTEDARSGHNYALGSACLHGHAEIVEWLFATFELTTADIDADTYRRSQNIEVQDMLFRVFEREGLEPADLYADTQAMYEAARERVHAARLAMQCRIKPEAR